MHFASGEKADVSGDDILTAGFDLKYGWSSSQAMLVQGAKRYTLIDFFTDKKKGPHKHKPLQGKSKEFEAMVDKALHQVAEDEVKVSKMLVTVDAAKLHEAMHEKQVASSKKAREALDAKATERATKRRISVGN